MSLFHRLPILVALAGATSCGPKDVIPNAPNHPGNPNAPLAAERPASREEPPPHTHDVDPHAHHGDAHKGHGDAHKGHGDAHKGHGDAHKDHGDAHKGHGDAHKGHGDAHKDRGDAHKGHGDAHKDRKDDKAAIAAAEMEAYRRAKPVFEKHCAKCHSSSGAKATKKKLDHFNMDTYPFGGHHAKEIGAEVREVLGLTGEEPTMPMDKPGSVKGAELDAILEWSRAFDRAHAAGVHPHHGDHGHGGH